jgi:hypothetical protein
MALQIAMRSPTNTLLRVMSALLATGELHLIRGEDYAKLEELIKVLPNLANNDKLQLAKNVLAQIDGADSTATEFVSAFQGTSDQTLQHIATAARLIQYRRALDQLKEMVSEPGTGEGSFQQYLKNNPWMFGAEYSELLSRRHWTRDDQLDDDQLDYMLRRTVDNYLEIVEIKTAFTESLFVPDRDRDVYYPSSRLSPVIGQVMRYIEEVERNRDSIRAKDDADTLKIRARAIVGRDHPGAESAALRNLNAHLHRIEVITFHQLVRIAERVLNIFEGAKQDEGSDFDNDIPF